MYVLSDIKKRKSHYLYIIISLLGFFLHQSARTNFGNLSISDLLLVMFVIYKVINKKIYIRKSHVVTIFLFLSLLTFVSIFYTPIVYNIPASGSKFIFEMIKILILLTYFFMGMEIVKNQLIDRLLTVYSYSAFFISIIGIIYSMFNISLFNEILFKYGTRFNGLMNDPNYFAILLITTLPFFIRKPNVNNTGKVIIITVIILSLFLSGSKTGLITLGVYLLFIFLGKNVAVLSQLSYKSIFTNILLLILLLYFLNPLLLNIETVLAWLNIYFPATTRLTIIFTNFDSAISSGGSGREVAWNVGVEIIKDSPIFGIGVSNYSSIGNKYFGTDVIAHNTYIQLAAEWGLPLTVLFFGGVILLIISATHTKRKEPQLMTIRDILIIFLVGSIGISLNNARFFWIILGSSLTYYLERISLKSFNNN